MLYRMPSVSFSFPFLPSLCMTKRRLCQRKCLYLTERTLCLVHKHDCLWRADDTQAETVTFLILSDPAWKGCNMLTLTRFFFFLLSPTRFGTARCYSSALFYLFIFLGFFFFQIFTLAFNLHTFLLPMCQRSGRFTPLPTCAHTFLTDSSSVSQL